MTQSSEVRCVAASGSGTATLATPAAARAAARSDETHGDPATRGNEATAHGHLRRVDRLVDEKNDTLK